MVDLKLLFVLLIKNFLIFSAISFVFFRLNRKIQLRAFIPPNLFLTVYLILLAVPVITGAIASKSLFDILRSMIMPALFYLPSLYILKKGRVIYHRFIVKHDTII